MYGSEVENMLDIEQIEIKRSMNQSLDAVYLISPEPHVVDCLINDFERRRYRRSYLVWTSRVSDSLACVGSHKLTVEFIVLPQDLQDRIDRSTPAREQIAQARILNVDFFPRESHLITFRDPWSFPMLFHPACNQLIRKHMNDLAQKV